MIETNGSSERISKIVIDEIAFRTNILALNAALAAGGASEAGVGYAIAADQVRAPTRRRAGAAEETALPIAGCIQQERTL